MQGRVLIYNPYSLYVYVDLINLHIRERFYLVFYIFNQILCDCSYGYAVDYDDVEIDLDSVVMDVYVDALCEVVSF